MFKVPTRKIDFRQNAMLNISEPNSNFPIPVITASRPDEELSCRDAIVDQFKVHGALLFRSISVGLEGFQRIVNSYSSHCISYPAAHRKRVSPHSKVQTVAPGNEALPLHSELSHTPFRPDVCWFYCVKAPTRGSQTILCDGAKLATLLPSHAIELLIGRLLRYRRVVSPMYWRELMGVSSIDQLQEFIRIDPRGQFYKIRDSTVLQDFVAPSLHFAKFINARVFANNILHNFRKGVPLTYPTFEDGTTIPDYLISEIGAVAQECTIDLQWRDQDLLMLDNTRFMHGRRAIIDPERTIWTQFSNADF
jgi:alpha-ketoglutarate-dependent taurine dioxygenase